MAKAFESWTVLEHEPIVKHSENLWTVRGTMRAPSGEVTRVMTLVKLADGRVLLHNAIALDDAEMRTIEAWGEPAILIVPSGFHRQDARIFKQRYPAAKVYCPKGSIKRVAQVVVPDGSIEDAPRDTSVNLSVLDGCPIEGVLSVRSDAGTTIVLNDSIANLPVTPGMLGLMLAPTGRPSVPRVTRWLMVKDKRAVRAHFERLADTPELIRLVVSHGPEITHQPAGVLRSVAAELVS